MTGTLVLAVLNTLWIATELWLAFRRQSRNITRDAGTLRLLQWVIVICVVLAVWLRFQPFGRFPASWQPLLLWSGCALLATGLILRWWAIRTLAQFFTVNVTIRKDHELIRSGPYRWLRHPSYTGALMCFLGLGLALGNIGSVLLLTVPVTWAFLRRIRHEEQVLREAFPDQYPDYARATSRLLPYVW